MSDQPTPDNPNDVPAQPDSPTTNPVSPANDTDAGSGIPPRRELISVTPLPADSDEAGDQPPDEPAGGPTTTGAMNRVKTPRPILDPEQTAAERPDLPERRTKAAPPPRPPEKLPPNQPQPQPIQPSQPVAKSQSIETSQPVEKVAQKPGEKPKPKSEAAPKSQPAKKSQPVQKAEGYSLVTFVSALRALSLTFAAAVIVSTIFMIFTSPDFLSAGTRKELGQVRATAQSIDTPPTALPTPAWFKHIGVVAGHSGIATYGTTRGNIDTGAVCPDGFTEASVTMKVAQQVVAALQGRGYTVDLLEEFDLRLDNFQAAAFISLHADSCDNFDDGFNHSGFKVAYPVDRLTVRDQDLRLNDCIRDNYGPVTGLPFTPGGITDAMTKYHAFHVSGGHPGIAPTTPGVILELGLLSYDRDLLQNHSDKSAKGIVNGLLCYLDPKGQPALPTVVPATLAPETNTPAPQ